MKEGTCATRVKKSPKPAVRIQAYIGQNRTLYSETEAQGTS